MHSIILASIAWAIMFNFGAIQAEPTTVAKTAYIFDYTDKGEF